jgi:hypothetical protein
LAEPWPFQLWFNSNMKILIRSIPLSIVSILIFAPCSAWAFRCKYEPLDSLEKRVERAELIVVGKLSKDLGKSRVGPKNSNHHVNVKILESLKGNAGNEVEVFFHMGTLGKYNCSREHFQIDHDLEYLLFLKLEGGKYYTSYPMGGGMMEGLPASHDLKALRNSK